MLLQKTEDFKLLYDRYKLSKSYNDRLKQSVFCDLAKNVISETLKVESLQNYHLTAFIQMFKANASVSNFENHLRKITSDEDTIAQILNEFVTNKQKGFTLAGRFRINSLNELQLSQVKSFLLSCYNVQTIEQAIFVIKKFEDLKIPEIKPGIFSPWLHYINPEIFPILNSTIINLSKWFEIDTSSYSNFISDFSLLNSSVEEKNFSSIDDFCQYFNKFCKDHNSLSVRIFSMKMSDDKLNQVYKVVKDTNAKYSKILENEYNFRNGIEIDEEIETVDHKRYWLLGSYIGDTQFAKGHETDEKNKDKTEYFMKNSIWINGYVDKFLTKVKSVKVGDEVAIKAVFVKNGKSTMRIKSKGIVTKNLKDGRHLEVQWIENFEQFEVDFTGGYWSTISIVSKPEHIEKIWL